MSEGVSEESVAESPNNCSEDTLESAIPAGEVTESDVPAGEPKVTFRGNSYDLISLGALITGAMILFSCLTCNMGYYCLPLVSIALGAVGVLSARQSVDARRTRLWSWVGIAAGAFLLFFIAALFALYIGFIVLAIVVDQRG
jgi:hypothetical protein